ncbi:hypothetical protein ACSQ67_009103 [Phaseolus vulgaris]
MKSSSSSSLPLTLPFLLFAISTTFASAFMDPPVMILDQNGVPVSASAEYYVAQLNGGPTGGGLTTGLGTNITCPLIVLQVYYEAVRGQKVKFTTRGTTKSDDKIRTGTPLDIEFVDKPSCASSSKWVVVYDSKYPGQWLGIGDAADLPGKKIVDGVFKIEKYSFLEGYKFMFCPTARNVCLNFARLEDANGRRLILVNETTSPYILEAGFDKATTSSKPLF